MSASRSLCGWAGHRGSLRGLIAPVEPPPVPLLLLASSQRRRYSARFRTSGPACCGEPRHLRSGVRLIRTHRTTVIARRIIASGLSVLMLGAITPWCCLVQSHYHHLTGNVATVHPSSHGEWEQGTSDNSRVSRSATRLECAFLSRAPQAKNPDSSVSAPFLRWTLHPASPRAIILPSLRLTSAALARQRIPSSSILPLDPPPPRAA